MKTVLLLIHADPGQESRLQAALDLTRALRGHLSCLDVTSPLQVMGDFYNTAGNLMILEEEREREAHNRAAIETRLAHEDVPWDWTDITGEIAHSVVDKARLADIVVTSRLLDTALLPDMRDITGRIVTQTRKPVLAVPQAMTRFAATGRALIAWDGSRTATEAMRAAIPLLALASDVRLFAVDDGRRTLSLSEAAAYLSRHDIHGSVQSVRDGIHAADRLIQAECEAWHADYVVMGAYGHGRLSEAVFGGVTRRMLSDSRLPLLLGH
ncbi:universal stress protein [Flavisphingomonas formosensis]|uniref:universal stress protein n=1 Tax=Flavisphingomonas formosensis TaxID=861534 RepID=UPI0012FAE661|nr:universal stress protein [Sphingomonas formosensis]